MIILLGVVTTTTVTNPDQVSGLLGLGFSRLSRIFNTGVANGSIHFSLPYSTIHDKVSFLQRLLFSLLWLSMANSITLSSALVSLAIPLERSHSVHIPPSPVTRNHYHDNL